MVPRIVTGLWQVADMERGGTLLDPVRGAADLADYAAAGFDAFDMADHYGSAEVITGTLLASPQGRGVRAFTKWCPPPGPMTAEPSCAKASSARSTGCRCAASTCCSSTGGRSSTPVTSTRWSSSRSCARKA